MANQPLEEIICMSWEKNDVAGGIIPDGFSLHLTKDDCEAYVNRYWAGNPQEITTAYSKPTGMPATVYAKERLYKRIQESDLGLRISIVQLKLLLNMDDLSYGPKTIDWASKG
jgi:hypothetical protein